MSQSPASPDFISGVLSLSSVLAALWLGRASLNWALDLRGSEGEARVEWAGMDRLLAWIALSAATCLALLQITSVVLAVIELPAILSRLEASRLFPSGWGVGSYELHLTFRVLLMVVVYALAGRLVQLRFRASLESSPRPVEGRGAARMTLVLGGGGLAFVLADGLSSGVQALPVSEWVAVGDPLAGYLAGWVASIAATAILFVLMSSRVASRNGSRPLG